VLGRDVEALAKDIDRHTEKDDVKYVSFVQASWTSGYMAHAPRSVRRLPRFKWLKLPRNISQLFA
jgi:hypothetical protein